METVPTCSGILSDGQPGPLLPQGEDVAAAAELAQLDTVYVLAGENREEGGNA